MAAARCKTLRNNVLAGGGSLLCLSRLQSVLGMAGGRQQQARLAAAQPSIKLKQMSRMLSGQPEQLLQAVQCVVLSLWCLFVFQLTKLSDRRQRRQRGV